ncbi:MAG: YraN family protein [Smithellaceae bacterium]|nr:YraN family protein [Smithellaceae bacterium]
MGTGIETGKKGEDTAVRFLKKKGFRIVTRNYRCVFGEVDIIAWDGQCLVFVEVKSRRGDEFGAPQLAVGADKQKKLSHVALNYLSENGLRDIDARFDVLAIVMAQNGPLIEHIENAFEVTNQ